MTLAGMASRFWILNGKQYTVKVSSLIKSKLVRFSITNIPLSTRYLSYNQ